MDLSTVTNYTLQENGFECSKEYGLFIFKRIRDPENISESLEECFGEGRKVYAITVDQLLMMGINELLNELREVL